MEGLSPRWTGLDGLEIQPRALNVQLSAKRIGDPGAAVRSGTRVAGTIHQLVTVQGI